MKANQNIAKFLETLDTLDLNGHHVPGLIMSRPGFGKTSTIELWCRAKSYSLVTVVPSTYSIDDITGLASVVDGKLVRLTPPWYDKVITASNNNKNRVVLFLDELSTANEFLQAPLLNVIFNHKIEDKDLPSNILIVAAGNYTTDLNNAFTMTAPLVNRFMVLNLWNKDYNISEMLNDSFETVTSKEDIEKYLGIKHTPKIYDIDKFKEWIHNTDEITFGKSEIAEDPVYGLTGFTSVRSLSYALKFTEAYIYNYSDNLWMRIVGDTLGRSEKREGKFLRVTLENNSELFRCGKKESKRTLEDLYKDFLNYSPFADSIPCSLTEELNNYVEHISLETITSQDMALLTRIFNRWPNNKDLGYINSKLSERLKNL